MTRRSERIGEQMRAELAKVLGERSDDPNLPLVTLTRVDVAPDLSNAIVHFSFLDLRGDAEPEEVSAYLESLAGTLRHAVAHNLPIRRAPALRFRHDPSLALGSQTLELLKDIETGDDGETT